MGPLAHRGPPGLADVSGDLKHQHKVRLFFKLEKISKTSGIPKAKAIFRIKAAALLHICAIPHKKTCDIYRVKHKQKQSNWKVLMM